MQASPCSFLLLNVNREAVNTNFLIVFGLKRLRIEAVSTVSLADAQSTQLLISVNVLAEKLSFQFVKNFRKNLKLRTVNLYRF